MAPMGRRHQADDARRLSVQQTASRVLLEAASLDEAMAEILQAIATELDWALAIYWVAVPDAAAHRSSLHCRAIWAEEAIVRSAGGRGVARRPAQLGAQDPPGQAVAGREAVWVSQLAGDDPRPRLRLAAAAGLRSVAAFPVRQRETVPAVIELYAREARPVDEGMLHLMTAIGHQICLVLHRMEAQAAALEALERSREELETVLRALPDGITVRDGAGRLVYANEAIARAAGLPDLRASPAELLGRFRMWDENGRPLSPDEIPRAPALAARRGAGPALPADRPATRGDRWVSLKAAPVAAARAAARERVVIVMRDVTAERRDQEWQRFLGDASTALASSMDLPAALEELAALAARTVADRCAVVLRRGNGEPRVVAFAGAVGADRVATPETVDRRPRADSLRAAQAASRRPPADPGERARALVDRRPARTCAGSRWGPLVLAAHSEGRRYGAVRSRRGAGAGAAGRRSPSTTSASVPRRRSRSARARICWPSSRTICATRWAWCWPRARSCSRARCRRSRRARRGARAARSRPSSAPATG